MVYVSNSFSIQMLPNIDICNVQFKKVSVAHVAGHLSGLWDCFTSCIGHEDTANVVAHQLDPNGDSISPWVNWFNRQSIKLKSGDILYVAQVVGGRLPEGTTKLPEGVSIEWYMVYLI